jgi:tetratricopeptide (TPR) repeat protein
MKEWLKTIFKQEKPAPPRPSEIEVDQRARDLVSLGNKMLATDDLVGAAEAYESALRLDGHSAEAWHRRGRIFMRNGQLMGAMACYARSLELDTRHAEVWSALGEAILEFLRKDSEPLFIRENRLEIVCEANDCFERALKIGGDLPKAKEGRETCRSMMKDSPCRIANPRLFTFHSGSILEEAKREVVSPFLRPSDYRRSRSDP